MILPLLILKVSLLRALLVLPVNLPKLEICASFEGLWTEGEFKEIDRKGLEEVYPSKRLQVHDISAMPKRAIHNEWLANPEDSCFGPNHPLQFKQTR